MHLLYTNSTKFFLQIIFVNISILYGFHIFAQANSDCPPNIDFENGSFQNWTCYTGRVAAVGSQNVMTLIPSNGPVAGQHTLFAAGNNELDYYGQFPVVCPNGSGYSVKLGNNEGGAGAEAISYTFTIPANRNTYSLTYHYAVVFQDPNHLVYQQPRLEIETKNLTDNNVLNCSSFTFFGSGTLLPGFYNSPNQDDTTAVWCKNWAAVTMNLNGNAGKQIRLTFKTADCTFRRHFGYAYIDVNTECSSQFTGADYCPDDTTVSVSGPYGYSSYKWFNNNFSQVLGTNQNIVFTPPPPIGTTVAVEVTPYNGYGCVDTFYALLTNTRVLTANAGTNKLSCNGSEVQLGAPPQAATTYLWSPSAGLSSATIANPKAAPIVNTQYVLNIASTGGGCKSSDTVLVRASYIDTSIQLIGKPMFCITSNDSAVLQVTNTNSIKWYVNNNIISGATGIRHKAQQSGAYFAALQNVDGCMANTATKNIVIEQPLPGINYAVRNAVTNMPFTLAARPIGITALWQPATFLSNSNIYNPKFTSATAQTYSIKLTTTAGCVTVDTQKVVVYKEMKIYVPSAFTPNNDGSNDRLFPVIAGFKQLTYFRIYNRWGQQIFDIAQNPLGWDGTYKGVHLGVQTIVWTAEGIGDDDQRYQYKGTTVLVR
jgi:gliding motility-associated-like protein